MINSDIIAAELALESAQQAYDDAISACLDAEGQLTHAREQVIAVRACVEMKSMGMDVSDTMTHGWMGRVSGSKFGLLAIDVDRYRVITIGEDSPTDPWSIRGLYTFLGALEKSKDLTEQGECMRAWEASDSYFPF